MAKTQKRKSEKIKGTLILLSLNEIEGLTALIPKIPVNEIDEVFAVDGGSTDGTIDFYKKKQNSCHTPDIQRERRGIQDWSKSSKKRKHNSF